MGSTTRTPLAALAEAAGVLTSYEDVFGERHAASEAALRGVLAAMHFDVADDERAAASLDSWRRRSVERVVEPFHVFAREERIAIDFVLAEDDANDVVTWSLTGEDATRRVGEIDVARAALVERVSVGDRTYRRMRADLCAPLDEGYYDLALTVDDATHRARAIVAPPSCYVPNAMADRGVWGLAVQLYALRSEKRAYAGDFDDLRALCATVRDAGGAAVGVNPLHLLPRGDESPYGPTSRALLNWAYLDVSMLPGYDATDDPARANPPVDEKLVEYRALYDEKWSAARAAYERFAERPSAERAAYDAFVKAGGERLRRCALFQALADRFRTNGGDDWRSWPREYRDPASASASAFAREATAEIAFYAYLQWQCDAQLARAARACDGMAVGIYRDVAVGSHLGGCDTWLGDGALSHEVAVGAPPDSLNRSGQNWGVAPFEPIALREAGYRPFADLIRANARHAGALRIDHVMGLLRLWWVPDGADASDGAYVSYRLGEMLAVLALESRRARCLVVGEDLGTVPPGFRERLDAYDVLSYRILQFERDEEDRFHAPHEYPKNALVAFGTHDLPPIAAYWNGTDIDTRVRIGMLAESDATSERAERNRTREQLRSAFTHASIDVAYDGRIDDAAHAFLARTPSRLMLVALEDVLGEAEQINMPTTTTQYPNWRHRYGISVEALASDARFASLVRTLSLERGALTS